MFNELINFLGLNQGLTEAIYSLLGWYGVVGAIVSYYLAQVVVKDKHQDYNEYLLSIFFAVSGSLAMVISTYHMGSYQPMVMEMLWILLSLQSLFKYKK